MYRYILTPYLLQGIEIPLEEDRTCDIKVVQSQFANAVGLRFRAPDTGRMRALKMGVYFVGTFK